RGAEPEQHEPGTGRAGGRAPAGVRPRRPARRAQAGREGPNAPRWPGGGASLDERRREMTDNVSAAPAGAGPNRRNWIVGAGFAWWRQRLEAADAGVVEHLWSLQFETPQGSSMAMANFRGKPLLVNFWATWCAPCVEEMPLLDAFYRQHASNGWQVVGLAI